MHMKDGWENIAKSHMKNLRWRNTISCRWSKNVPYPLPCSALSYFPQRSWGTRCQKKWSKCNFLKTKQSPTSYANNRFLHPSINKNASPQREQKAFLRCQNPYHLAKVLFKGIETLGLLTIISCKIFFSKGRTIYFLMRLQLLYGCPENKGCYSFPKVS